MEPDQHRRVRLFSSLMMITIWVSVLAGSIINHNPETLYFLIFSVLVSNLLPSPRATVLVFTATLITVLLLPLSSVFPFNKIITPALLVGFTGALATITVSVQQLDIRHIQQQSQQISTDLIEL